MYSATRFFCHGAEVRGLRIGFIRHFHEEDMPADAEVTAALEHVAGTLHTLGAETYCRARRRGGGKPRPTPRPPFRGAQSPAGQRRL